MEKHTSRWLAIFHHLLQSILNVAIALWLVAAGPFCWILRDGLGPAAVDSNGMEAVSRFLLTFYWGPIAAGLITLRLAVSLGAKHVASSSTESPLQS